MVTERKLIGILFDLADKILSRIFIAFFIGSVVFFIGAMAVLGNFPDLTPETDIYVRAIVDVVVLIMLEMILWDARLFGAMMGIKTGIWLNKRIDINISFREISIRFHKPVKA